MTVYFAQQERGPIKVGWTTNIEGRLAALRTSASCRIDLLAEMDGDKRTESYIHSRLSDYRAHGEWFHPTAAVLYFVEMVKRDGIDCIPAKYRPSTNLNPRVSRDTTDLVAEAKEWIEGIASPQPLGENFTATLKRVAALAGVSPRAVKAIWYDETKQLNAHVYVGLKESFDAKLASELGASDSSRA